MTSVSGSEPAHKQVPSSRRGALTLMGGTLASRVTGLVRNSLLAQFFPPAVLDAFVTAFKVPNLFRELLAEGALTNSFVPVYKRLSSDDARRLTGALLSLLVIVNGVLLIVAYLAAPFIARLLIADAGNVDVELTTRLIRIVFPFLPAISLSALAMGVLNAEERFLAPAWAPVALNVVTVTCMALFPGQAVMLALAHVLGGAAQLIVQLPALQRLGLMPRLGALRHPALGSVALLMVPFAFTAGGRQVLNVIASNVITGIDAGAQGAYYLADLFLSLALGLFSISPALAYYSRLSAQAVHEREAFGATLQDGLRFITFLTVPAGLALWLLAGPAVDVVYNWRSLVDGSMDPTLRLFTIAATAPLGLAVFPLGVFNLLIRTFYIRGNVRTPVLLVLATLTLQAGLYLLLAPWLGIAGVSWSVAIGAVVQLVAAAVLVHRTERFGLASYVTYALKVWLAAGVAVLVAAGAVGLTTFESGWFGQLGTVALGGTIVIAVYLVVCIVLRVPEVGALGRRFRR